MARERFELVLRVANRSDNPAEKVARIHHGSSEDGLRLVLDDRRLIAPSHVRVGESYLKDLPRAEMYRLNSGHLAVEDSLQYIAETMADFNLRACPAVV